MMKIEILKSKKLFLVIFLFYSTLGFSVTEPEIMFLDLPFDVILGIFSKINLHQRSNILQPFLLLQNRVYQESNKKETFEDWNKHMKHFSYSMIFSETGNLRVKTPAKIDLFVDSLETTKHYFDEKASQALKNLKTLIQKEPHVMKNLLPLHYEKFKKNILHFAATQGDFALIELLFLHAKDLMLQLRGEKDIFQKTPFQIAQSSIFKTEEERKKFRKEKKELTEKQKNYLLITCILLDVTDEKEIERILSHKKIEIGNGRDFFDIIQAGDNTFAKSLLLDEYKNHFKNKKLVNFTSFFGETALMCAIQFKKTELAKDLIVSGADINHVQRYGNTLLMTALAYHHPEIAKELIAKGANVNAVDYNGTTVLMLALIYNYLEIAKALIAKGANVNAVKYDGTTVLMLALKAGYLDLAKESIIKARIHRKMKIRFFDF